MASRTPGVLVTDRGSGAVRQHPAHGANPTRSSAVQIRSLGKTFRRSGRRTVAFEGVDLTVEPGEFVCLLGPSGCGKSTLLRVVAGILPADRGTVTVGSRSVDGPGPDRGMLFQTPLLFPWLTARDNVLFGPRAQRSRGLIDLTDEELRHEADAILETVGLTDFADAYPHELSGGMQHRAAFARALITRPDVLLMDEPFGALDAITRLRMQQFLLSMWEQYGLTIMFVTHDIEEAILLGDRVAVMGGRPPGIAEVVDIPLRRPRDAYDADTPQFLATKRHIRGLLKI
jgi:NitT/TauT family transport system ATP-binding protein